MTDMAMTAFGGAVALRCPRTGRLHLATLPHRVVPGQRRSAGGRTAALHRPHRPRRAHPRGSGAAGAFQAGVARLAGPATRTEQPAAPAAPAAAATSRRTLIGRALLLLAGVGGLGAAAATLPLHQLPTLVSHLGPAASVAVAVVGGLLLAVLVPRTAVTLACGALLGATTGAMAALAAAVIAIVVTYLAGRWAGRGALAARAGSRLDRLDAWLNRRGLGAVLLVRFLPLAPFGLIGYAYGTTSVCRRHYLVGSTLASIPSAITYAVIGAAVTAPGRMSPVTLAPAAIGFLLTTTIVWRWRRAAKRGAALPA
jgi:uncharacterized membrane protein YdjX (TVP38/TMEM64 family)